MVHFYKFINELYILFNQLLTIFINNHFINLYFLILIYFSCIFYMNFILNKKYAILIGTESRK